MEWSLRMKLLPVLFHPSGSYSSDTLQSQNRLFFSLMLQVWLDL